MDEHVRESRVFTEKKGRPWKLVVRLTKGNYEVSKCFADEEGGYEYIQTHHLSGALRSYEMRLEALEKSRGILNGNKQVEDKEKIENEI